MSSRESAYSHARRGSKAMPRHSKVRRAQARRGRKSTVPPLGCSALLSRYPMSRSRVTSRPMDSTNCET